ncbi:MAG: ABC transporter ATP-binding protein [Candidatus Leucobacter sulfamidivorax]|nr:ABC transporter ATP-binding protein [Candidatus Leucobacter sulfamidivorax]
MTDPTPTDPQRPVTPSRRDRLRPLELIGFAAVLAVFAGLVVLLVLRDGQGLPNFAMAGTAAGIVFIVVLLVVALVGLGGKPSAEDLEARKDLRSPGESDGDERKDSWH